MPKPDLYARLNAALAKLPASEWHNRCNIALRWAEWKGQQEARLALASELRWARRLARRQARQQQAKEYHP